MANSRIDSPMQPPVNALDSNRNCKRAAYALRGILKGIVADDKLGHQEILVLNAWLQSQPQISDENARELQDLIGNVLADGVITTDERQDMYILIDDIIEFGDQPGNESDGLLQELLGLSRGLVSDGEITESEFVRLTKWIIENEHIANAWPANEIFSLVNKINEDGVADQDELDSLQAALKKLSTKLQ